MEWVIGIIIVVVVLYAIGRAKNAATQSDAWLRSAKEARIECNLSEAQAKEWGKLYTTKIGNLPAEVRQAYKFNPRPFRAWLADWVRNRY